MTNNIITIPISFDEGRLIAKAEESAAKEISKVIHEHFFKGNYYYDRFSAKELSQPTVDMLEDCIKKFLDENAEIIIDKSCEMLVDKMTRTKRYKEKVKATLE